MKHGHGAWRWTIILIFANGENTSSSIKLSATGRLLDITYMCYEYRTPLFPAQLLQARQSDLSVTSIPQSVNRWRHNEYSWCSHPLHFVQASNTPVVKVRLVVWRSDLTGQGAKTRPMCSGGSKRGAGVTPVPLPCAVSRTIKNRPYFDRNIGLL